MIALEAARMNKWILIILVNQNQTYTREVVPLQLLILLFMQSKN